MSIYMFESFFIYTIHPTIQSATHTYSLYMHQDMPVASSNSNSFMLHQWTLVSGNQFAVSPVLKHWRYNNLTPSQQNLVIQIGQWFRAKATVLCYTNELGLVGISLLYLQCWSIGDTTTWHPANKIQIGQWFRAKATVLCYTNELGLVGISLLYLQCWSIGDTTTWHPANKIYSHPDRPVVSGKSNSFMLHQWTLVSGNQFAVSPVLKHWRYNNLTPSQQNLVIQIGQWFRAKATVLCYTNELGLVGISLLYLQCWSIGDTTTWHPANKIYSHPDRPVVSGKSNSFMLHQWTLVSGNQFAVSPVLKHWRYNNLTPSQQNLVIQIGQWFRAKATVLCYTNELGLVGISLLYLQCWSIGDTTTWHPANKIYTVIQIGQWLQAKATILCYTNKIKRYISGFKQELMISIVNYDRLMGGLIQAISLTLQYWRPNRLAVSIVSMELSWSTLLFVNNASRQIREDTTAFDYFVDDCHICSTCLVLTWLHQL